MLTRSIYTIEATSQLFKGTSQAGQFKRVYESGSSALARKSGEEAQFKMVANSPVLMLCACVEVKRCQFAPCSFRARLCHHGFAAPFCATASCLVEPVCDIVACVFYSKNHMSPCALTVERENFASCCGSWPPK